MPEIRAGICNADCESRRLVATATLQANIAAQEEVYYQTNVGFGFEVSMFAPHLYDRDKHEMLGLIRIPCVCAAQSGRA